jgi:hypothetical protein
MSSHTEPCVCGKTMHSVGTAGKGRGYIMECSYCRRSKFDDAHLERRLIQNVQLTREKYGDEKADCYEEKLRSLSRFGENG